MGQPFPRRGEAAPRRLAADSDWLEAEQRARPRCHAVTHAIIARGAVEIGSDFGDERIDVHGDRIGRVGEGLREALLGNLLTGQLFDESVDGVEPSETRGEVLHGRGTSFH